MDYDRKKLGWHFVGATLRDGRPIPPDGEWLIHHGHAKMCEAGLHLGITPCDALEYAPGETLCLVEYADEVDREGGKILCRRRRIIARMDATEVLWYFARMQAVSVLDLWTACPPDVVLDYLMTGADMDAAYSASVSVSAWASASASASVSAWARAWARARASASASASESFNALVYECFEDWL